MNIVNFKDLENKNLFFEFCKEADQEKDQPASINMWNDNWENLPNTLPYIVFKSSRFSNSNGNFHFVIDNNKIIGCSGIYISDFCKDLAIAGCRTWVKKEYRHLSIVRNILLPREKEWAIENNLKAIGLTFNDYNKNLLRTFTRQRFGENRSPRQPYHLFYNNFNELDFSVNIKYTRQWIAYETLDPEFNFDWTTIMWNK